MADLAKLVVKLEAESSQLRTELEKTNKRLVKWEKKASSSLERVASSFKRAFFVGAAAAGVGSVFDLLGKMVSESDKAERQIEKLGQLIETTGGVSGLTAKQIDDFSRSLARSTLASTEGVRDAAGVLLTFKSVSGETFRETISLAQDMAAVMGSDIKSATLQLAKALEDPVAGLSALRESGVSFTKAEQDMIKSMQASGRQLEAQTAILAKVRDQVGGAGKAEARGTLIGAIDRLGQSWDELFEKIGQSGIARAAIAFIDGLTKRVIALGRLIRADDQSRFYDLADKRNELKSTLAAEKSRPEAAQHKPLISSLEAQLEDVDKEMRRIQDKNIARIKAEKSAVDAMNQGRIEAANTIGHIEDGIIKKLETQRSAFDDLVERARKVVAGPEKTNLASGTVIEAINALGKAKTFESAGDTEGQMDAAGKALELIEKLSEAGKISKQYANSLIDQAAELGGKAADRMIDLKLDDKALEAEADRARQMIQANFSSEPFTAAIEWINPGKTASVDPLPEGATRADGSPIVINVGDKGSYKATMNGDDMDAIRRAFLAQNEKRASK